MAQWLRRPTVETLVFTGSSPALAKNYFLRILEQKLTQCIVILACMLKVSKIVNFALTLVPLKHEKIQELLPRALVPKSGLLHTLFFPKK